MGRRTLRGLFALALLAAGAACGGDGGGGGGGGVDPPTSSLTFNPAQSAPTNSLSLVRTNGTDPNELVLELRATGVSDLYAVAFDLTYPSSLRYDSATEGTWLSASGSVQTSLQIAQQTGRLVVGLSRLGAVGGASGDGALLSLRFSAVTTGNGAFEFVGPRAYNSFNVAYTAQWIGGSVAVVR